RWTGWLKAPRAGRYTLHLDSSDGSRVWLDGKRCIDRWQNRAGQHQVEVELTDRAHALRIDYFTRSGPAEIRLRWAQSGGFVMQSVPSCFLFHERAAAETAAIHQPAAVRAEEVRQFAGHAGGAVAVAFLPSGREFVTGGTDGTMRL